MTSLIFLVMMCAVPILSCLRTPLPSCWITGASPFVSGPAMPFPLPFPVLGSFRPPPPGMMMPPPQAKIWSEHKHPDGRTYFYNRLTMQSVWERPSNFDAMAPIFVPPVVPPSTTAAAAGTAAALEVVDTEAADKKHKA